MFGGGNAYVLVVVWLKEGAAEVLSVRPFVSVGSHVRVRRSGGETVLAAVADAVAVAVRGTTADGVMVCVTDGCGDGEADGEAPVRGIDAVGVCTAVAVGNGSEDAVRPVVDDIEETRDLVPEAESVFAADDEPPVIGADTVVVGSCVPCDAEMVEVTAFANDRDSPSDFDIECRAVCVHETLLNAETLTDTSVEAEAE